MAEPLALNGFKDINRLGLGVPILLLSMLAMMMLPLPTFFLDLLFTFNISLSLVILLAVIYSKRPLDFGVFPTILLISTLLRLSLNIASTRVVLLHGKEGSGAAGKVIEAFGDFVVGGNYTVGFVVFAILVIINFVVVTKGAGRISEVTARFTLDAMPGKQMAIDADLNAGVIDQDEARIRRQEVTQEADFYGSMDGASKFVKGDAIAGIIILVINLLGGLVIGTLQYDMSIADAARVFTLLTIGDGLVAQIPSLLLSSATAIMVTRVSTEQDMGDEIVGQLFAEPKTLAVSGGVIGLMGIIPGMPNLVFLTLAGAAGVGSYYLNENKKKQRALAVVEPPPPPPPPENVELSWDDVIPIDSIGLEVGYRLIPLVDKAQGGELLGRLKGVRKKLSQELGFLIPPVHIRDNLDLGPSSYRISLMGATLNESDIHVDKELAINPGQVYGEIEGLPGNDPVFNLEAYWIDPPQRDQAQSLGYTVVDSSTVVATHLSQTLQDHAHELLGHDEVQQLLDRLAETSPKLVEDLIPKVLSLGVIVKVLQNLLREQIPIRDMRSIIEVLSEFAPQSQDPVALTAAVRIALGRMIVQQINGMNDDLPVITLDGTLEQILQQSVKAMSEGGIALEPGLASQMLQSLKDLSDQQETAGQPAVLLVPDNLRDFLARFIKHSVPSMNVLAFSEIPESKQITIIASVGGQ
ncbi:MAG: flagellar biosynthesis protein FlhA [Gammaproteobacteria bacterium]